MQTLSKNEKTDWMKATATLVPLFFSPTVAKELEDPMRGEEMLCLSILGYVGQESPVGLEMRIRPDFSREEAQLLTESGVSGLLQRKFAKVVELKKGEEPKVFRLHPVELTAKAS